MSRIDQKPNGSISPPTRSEGLVWFLHVIPYGESVTVPELGEVTPWICMLAEKEQVEPLAVTAYPEEPDGDMVREIVEDEILIGGTIPRAVEVFDSKVAEHLTPLSEEHNFEVIVHSVDPNDLANLTAEFTADIDPEALILALTELSPEQEDALDLMGMVEDECVPSDKEWLLHFGHYPEEVDVPGLGRLAPWIGIMIDSDDGEATLAMVSPEEPNPEILIATTIGHMINMKVIPATLEITDPAFLDFVEALGELYGFKGSMADDERRESKDLERAVANADREEIEWRLAEYAELG